MNVFTVAGRVTGDAEQRFTASGTAVLGFSVATDVGFGDKKHAIFIRCSLWGKRGEALSAYITKGLPVTVTGELDQRKFEHKGETKYSLELNVNEIALQGGKRDKPQSGHDSTQSGYRDPPKADPGFADDDIPF